MSKKGENIYKRKDGRWEARYIKCYSIDGKARYGYCYGRTYREAKEKVYSARALLNNPDPPDGLSSGTPYNTPRVMPSSTPYSASDIDESNKKIAVFCDEWLRLKRSKVKESTYVKYHAVIEKHIKPMLGNHKANLINELLLEQLAYDLLHERKLSTKTTKDILTVLHAVLKYAEKQTPSLNLSRIDVTYPKVENKQMRVLTREEQTNFTQFLLTSTDYCKFGTLLALLTGLRIGEICALRWQDISLDEGIIHVKSTMQRIKNLDSFSGVKTRIVISDPKSFSSTRVIPLSPLAFELCCKFYTTPNAYILTGEPNRYMEPRTLQYRMTRYAKECGMPDVHFHTLRHSFATRCVEVGFEIKSLSEVLGHASPQITLERYVHSSIELKRENMMKLSAMGY